MKRFLAALLAALTVFTLTGCGKTENPAEPVTPGQAEEPATPTEPELTPEEIAEQERLAADFSRWTFRRRLRKSRFSTTQKSDFQIRAIFSADRTYFAPL